jgi:bifunctional DNA-binding transcriptional regulator/antitoxin component of YhaV-PrlF toxin-antitoxin module
MLTRLDEKARLLIPAEIRKKLGFLEKDAVFLEPVGPGEFRVIRLDQMVKESRGMYSHLKETHEDITGSFIKERRLEASLEEEKDEKTSS